MEKSTSQWAMSHSLLLESVVMVPSYRITLLYHLLLVTVMILVWQQHWKKTRPEYSCLSFHCQTTDVLKAKLILHHYCSSKDIEDQCDKLG